MLTFSPDRSVVYLLVSTPANELPLIMGILAGRESLKDIRAAVSMNC